MRKAVIVALGLFLTPVLAWAAPVLAPETPEAAEDLDWSALNVDAATLLDLKPAHAPTPKAFNPAASSYDRKDHSDGSSALSIRQSLPTAWDAKIGVDLGLAAPASSTFDPEKLPNGAATTQSSGSAWGSVALPGASFDARLDPTQDQGKVGTRLSKSIPLGETLSVTVQNGYSVTSSLANGNGSLPSSGVIAAPSSGSSQIYSTDRTARVDILNSGTSFSAGAAMSSIDDKWLRSVGAEQKLFDGISLSGTVSETASGAIDKTVKAGFKKSW